MEHEARLLHRPPTDSGQHTRSETMTHDTMSSLSPANRRRSLFAIACFALVGTMCSAGCASQASGSNEPRWISLFNGKNLKGWHPKITGYDLDDNFANTFRVEDGVLKVCYDQYEKFDGKFGHLFYETPFSHYRMRVEYRFRASRPPAVPAGPSAQAESCSIASRPRPCAKTRISPSPSRPRCSAATGRTIARPPTSATPERTS